MMSGFQGWIYIGVDAGSLNECKIGLTYNENPWYRFIQTTLRPSYSPYRAYKIFNCNYKLAEIEKYLHHKLAQFVRVTHAITDENSEWFQCHPSEAEWIVSNEIAGFTCAPRNEDGIDISEIIISPYQSLMDIPEGYQNYSGYISLFFDSKLNRLPLRTFLPWGVY